MYVSVVFVFVFFDMIAHAVDLQIGNLIHEKSYSNQKQKIEIENAVEEKQCKLDCRANSLL